MVIGAEKKHPIAPRDGDALVHRIVNALVRLRRQAGDPRALRFQPLTGAIRGGAIDDDQL